MEKVQIITMTDQQLQSLIKKCVKDAVAEFKEEQKQKKPLLNKKEAASMLGVTTLTLNRWDKAQYINSIHVGSKVFYKYEDILNIQQR